MNFKRGAKSLGLKVQDLSKGNDDRVLKSHGHALWESSFYCKVL